MSVEHSRKAVHDWVQKADLQLDGGANPEYVAVDESVIRINDQQYWLYAAVNPATNHFHHIRLFSTYTTALSEIFLQELREKHDVDDALFHVEGADWLQLRFNDTTSILDTNATEIVTALNVSSVK